TSAGMTENWDALVHFRNGLDDWKAYTVGDQDRLMEAIDHFKAAVQKDTQFALAYYRLGLAYREDNQPSLAIKHLRKSIEVRPDFVAGYNALASTLYDFDYLLPGSAAASTNAEGTSKKTRQAHRVEASELWNRVLLLPRQVLSPSDVATAYGGLCR